VSVSSNIISSGGTHSKPFLFTFWNVQHMTVKYSLPAMQQYTRTSSSYQNETPCTLTGLSLFLLASGNYHSILNFSEMFVCFYFTSHLWVTSYAVSCAWLISLNIHHVIMLQIAGFHSFLWPGMYVPHFPYPSSINGHFGWLHSFAIVNSAALNMEAQMSLWISI
jgi:hypothetical protein